MKIKQDMIRCRGFTYQAHVGFHANEQNRRQKISLDLDAVVLSGEAGKWDRVDSVKMDYYQANQLLKSFFDNKRFNLVEAVAEEVAVLLLKEFDIEAIWVTVTKYPEDMPNIGSVSYRCYRTKTS